MTASQISVCLGLIALVFLLTNFTQGKPTQFFGLFALLVVIMSVWLYAIYRMQHSPHLITSHIGSRVLSSIWVTNPAYVSPSFQTVATSNGLQTVAVWKTNYYWHVWSIWK